MKRNAVFLVVIFLVSAVIGFAGFGIYRNMQNMGVRITNLETHGIDGQYDFNNNLVKIQDLNKFFEHKVYIRTSVTLEVPEELRDPGSEKSTVKMNEAPAVVIGRHVLTASHVSDAEILNKETIMINTPFGALGSILEYKVLEHKVALLLADGSEYPLKELYRNKKEDFSLFEMPVSPAGGLKDNKTLNFPFEIGKSDELKIGNFIYLNGRPSIRSEVARPGFVTSLVNAVFDEALGVKKNSDEFGLSQSTDLGDSGSPVMAFRDGQPELVGIYLGWVGGNNDNGKNTRSRALKINMAVDEIKEKLGLDLRKIQHGILFP